MSSSRNRLVLNAILMTFMIMAVAIVICFQVAMRQLSLAEVALGLIVIAATVCNTYQNRCLRDRIGDLEARQSTRDALRRVGND